MWQKQTIRDAVSMAFGETYNLLLPKTGFLSSLMLYISASPQSAYLDDLIKWRLQDWISKIEVIADGSLLLKSFDGVQAIASAFFDDGRLPALMNRTYTTTPQRIFIPIHFGRHWLDELYGIDLSRYNSVELKITNDASTTSWQTAFTITVVGNFITEVASPFIGYFREEEWKTYLPVADQWEYHQLPIGDPIRRILIRHRPFHATADCKASSSFHNGGDDIEFNIRSGQTRLYRGSLEVLGHMTAMELDLMAELRGSVNTDEGKAFETGVGYCMQNLGYGGADADNITTALSNMSKDVQHSAQEMANNAATGPLAYVVYGHGFGHCVPIFFARKPGLEDLLIPADVQQVDLNIHAQSGSTFTGTGTSAETAIVLSRLRQPGT